jgi:hypothetical protein
MRGYFAALSAFFLLTSCAGWKPTPKRIDCHDLGSKPNYGLRMCKMNIGTKDYCFIERYGIGFNIDCADYENEKDK